MAVLFAAIWANLETVRLGYQLEQLQRQREVLAEKGRQLQSERAQAAALSRVEEIARGKLGLVSPRVSQIILVKDEAAVSDERAGRPATSKVPELIGPPAPVSTEEGF